MIFYISSLAESNRLPFDLSECEQELVGGYHTEYGGLRMVLFFIGEYTHLITISFLTSILFFGGWNFPWIATPESAYFGAWLVKILVLLAKVLFSVFLDHAHSLDDSAVPVRSADGADVESVSCRCRWRTSWP